MFITVKFKKSKKSTTTTTKKMLPLIPNIAIAVCTQFIFLQSTRQDMKIHEASHQADHLQLTVKWLEETRLKTTEALHRIQQISNDSGILDSKVQTLSTNVNNAQVSAKKMETHIRELQVFYWHT